MTLPRMMRQPSAFVPVAMSLLALQIGTMLAALAPVFFLGL